MGSEADSAQCLGGDTNMSFIHHAIAKKIKEDKDKDKLEPDDSPIKTVLGSLARNSLVSDTISVQNQNMNNPGPTHRRKRRRQWKPISIEDVPFRRQDRLTLNVRNRMDRDRKLIFFIVGMGVLLIAIGLGLLLLHKLYGEDVKEIRPVVVIGPCLLAAGGMCLFLSGEVCLRLYKQTKKVLDPDLDNIANPHEVKHWMDPRLIPFGWGLFDLDDEVIVIEREPDLLGVPMMRLDISEPKQQEILQI